MASRTHTRDSAAEPAAILALAFRAGLANKANGNKFAVEPAGEYSDLHRGFDLVIHKGNRRLLVDVTTSKRSMGKKIARTVEYAGNGGHWVYILKVEWQDAWDVFIHPCFGGAFGQLRDGKPSSLEQACPEHGNKCELAPRLLDFSWRINRVLADDRETEAHEFAMEVPDPPF
ncbi:hypothetical protein GTO10_02600 [Candidatus Saccharibacteria bacterium]|nr:hypothetical protein [Candidatus Saccharibacteria bacterium]